MGKRKYNLDDQFFDDLGKELPAYWLGAISSDGYISPPNRIGIEVSSEDKEWLESFKLDVSYEGEIKTYPRSKTGLGNAGSRSRIIFTSTPIFERLVGLGLDNHKTDSIKFCQNVPKGCIRHYLRGLIDGDGSLHYSNKKRQWRISLRGTYSITEGFSFFVHNLTGRKLKTPRQNESTFYIEYYGNRIVRQICNTLYEDCIIFLPRKKALADEIF